MFLRRFVLGLFLVSSAACAQGGGDVDPPPHRDPPDTSDWLPDDSAVDDLGPDPFADPDSAVEASIDAPVDSTRESAASEADSTLDSSVETEIDSAVIDSGDSGAEVIVDAPVTCTPVVNELMTDGVGGAADEFVELYLPCGADVRLDGWKLVYRAKAGSTDVVLADLTGLVLHARGYLLFAGSAYSGGAPADKTFGGPTGALSYTAGGVAIRNPLTEAIDSVGYGTGVTNGFVHKSPAPAPASGRSIARTPDGASSGDDSYDFVEGTPTPRTKG